MLHNRERVLWLGEKQVRVVKVGKSMDTSSIFDPQPVDPLTGLPFISGPLMEVGNDLVAGKLRWEPTIHIDPRTDKEYTYDWITGEISIPIYDCNDPCQIHAGWFCHSKKWGDVPKCCKATYGSYKGTYVWVPTNHRNELAKLVFTIMDYANVSPSAKATKSVEVYLDENGNQVTKGSHTKIATATVPINAPEIDIRKALGLPLDDPRLSNKGELKKHLEDARSSVDSVRSSGIEGIKTYGKRNKLPLGLQDDQNEQNLIRQAQEAQDSIDSNAPSIYSSQELTTPPHQTQQMIVPNYLLLQQGLNAATPGAGVQMIQP